MLLYPCIRKIWTKLDGGVRYGRSRGGGRLPLRYAILLPEDMTSASDHTIPAYRVFLSSIRRMWLLRRLSA